MVGHTNVEPVPHQLELMLQLMLQHSDITTTWSSVCRLLCVSKGVQHTVLSRSICQQVTLGHGWSEAKARSFAGFVKKFGQLVVNLAHHAVPTSVTAALMYAALQPQGLQIQSLISYSSSAQLMCLLPLFHKTLTRLHLAFGTYGFDDAYETPVAAELVLSQLSKLRSLRIELEDRGYRGLWPLLSVISELTRLTTLTVLQIMPEDLSQLPANLQELYFSYNSDHYLRRNLAQAECYSYNAPVALQLTKTTALAKLGGARLTNWSSSPYYGLRNTTVRSDEEGHMLRQHDVLPSSLQQATLLDIESVQPLLHSTKLQDLSVLAASTSATNLWQLGAVSSLTSVSICYGSEPLHDSPAEQQGNTTDTSPVMVAVIHAMSALPVTCLHLRRNCLPLDAASALGGLTALTALTLDGSSEVCAAAKEIAAALSQLTRLQHLSLGTAEVCMDTPEADQNSHDSDEDCVEYGEPVFYGINSLLSHGNRTTNHYMCSAKGPRHILPKLPEDYVLPVCEAILELKQLRSLSIFFKPMTADAARQLQELGTATQLTLLRLACQLTDGAIASLLGSLASSLKHLDLGGETVVGEDLLAVVGQGLPHVTKLEMGWLLPWSHLAGHSANK